MGIGDLDELDEAIIRELHRDGRQAKTEIARRLGVSDGTIRNRIRRLVSKNVIRIAASVNLSRLGYSVDVNIGIHCEPGRVAAVAQSLEAMEEVRYVGYVAGAYDLWVAAYFRSGDELLEFLLHRLGSIPGIRRTQTMQMLKVVKRDYDYRDSSPYPQGGDEVGADEPPDPGV